MTTATKPRERTVITPYLVGSDSRPSRGVTLRLPINGESLSARFFQLSLNKVPRNNPKFDGYIIIKYTWKDLGVESTELEDRDEDIALFGVRGCNWSRMCSNSTVLKKFTDELLSLHGREVGVVVLSYSYKTFRDITIDRTGEEYKIKNNARRESLFSREVNKKTNETKMVTFSFIEKRWFPIKADKCIEVIRNYFINHTRFVEL